MIKKEKKKRITNDRLLDEIQILRDYTDLKLSKIAFRTALFQKNFKLLNFSIFFSMGLILGILSLYLKYFFATFLWFVYTLFMFYLMFKRNDKA